MATVNATNKIINPYKVYAIKVKHAVHEYDKRKEYNKNNPRGFKGMWNTALCSLCKRGMRKDIAKLQIENKRENAPICMACIMGYKRKDKVIPYWKPETIKKFKSLNYDKKSKRKTK